MGGSIHGKVMGHEPCPACGSRDNVARYADGYAKCFGNGCGWYQMPDGQEGLHPMQDDDARNGPPLLDIEPTDLRPRGIRRETCEAWGYGIATDETGRSCQVANEYDANGRVVSQKIRYPKKKFQRRGDKSRALLFGQRARSSKKQIIVTEGELDCLAVAQAHNLKWPVVSLPDGASSALRALSEHSEWLDSHDEIVLFFDNDEPGQEAARECAERLLVGPGKIKLAQLDQNYKDAGEAMAAGDTKAIMTAVWNAKEYRPGGVVLFKDLWEQVSATPERGLSYPWTDFTDFTHGMRHRELVTWCAGSGVGKSAFVKEVAYRLATRYDQRVGIVALEESVRRTALDLIGIGLSRRLSIPEVYEATDPALMRATFDSLGDRFMLYDHFGSMDDGALMAKLRYMAGSGGCEWIVLDHISIVVSAMAEEGDERKRIDRLMTNLRSFVEQTGIGLHLVSHLRRQSNAPHEEGGQVHLGDLRGSQSIAQLSDWVVGVERDQQDDDDFERNMCTLRVLKNRPFGDTGEAAEVWYDKTTGRLVDGEEARARHLIEEDTDDAAAA